MIKLLLEVLLICHVSYGILYPKFSKTRELKSLDGLWTFSLNNTNANSTNTLTGNDNDKDIFMMPVPSSFNDVLTSFNGKEYVGCVKYEKTVMIPKIWSGSRIFIRFGSVCYAAQVYINDVLATSHEIGHLPFETEITNLIDDEKENKITVIVNNTLTYTTIPQGYVMDLPGGRRFQRVLWDFFNYAGIDRSVFLYRTRQTRVEDITITTSVRGNNGIVNYSIEIDGDSDIKYNVTILDKTNNIVASSDKENASLTVTNANFWWPYLMNDNPAYMYTLRVELLEKSNGFLLDRYDQPFGIRELKWDNTSFKINGKTIYFRGFGRHEDSDIRGKGIDLPLIIRDHNLIRWVGGNVYRTSHYPYAEEIMDLADKFGIMIIDEVPAVNTQQYSEELLEKHKKAIEQLYRRDKNRPSVIMWSLANEPRTDDAASESYYKQVVSHMKHFDQTRPITVVNSVDSPEDYSGQFLDILCFNRYDGWGTGDVSVVVSNTVKKATAWYNLHQKPVILMEYGAETIPGMHMLPGRTFSEDFQVELMSEHFKAFDQLRQKGWFIGEFIWNFADFQTPQSLKKCGGNRKGIFTRQREPKASAHFLRRRYWSLAAQIDNATIPTNLDLYVISK